MCVVRWLYKYEDEVIDGLRIYVEGDKYYACKRNNDGEYVKTNIQTLSGKNFISTNSEEIDLDDLTGTRLQYFSSIVNNIPSQYRTMLLIISMLNPKMEQLLKNGYEKQVYKLIGNEIGNLKDPMREIELRVNLNYEAKDLNKWLGINKYQKERFMAVADKLNENAFNLIGDVKKIFSKIDINGSESIACYDNDIFDTVLKCVSKFGRSDMDGNYCNIGIDEMSSFLSSMCLCDNIEKTNTKKIVYNMDTIMKDVFNYSYYRLRMYEDYLDMYMKIMNNHSKMKIYLTTYEDVVSYHDTTVALYNLKRNVFLNESFKRNIKKVERLSWEDEKSDFAVVIPEKADDLGAEGAALRHCVQSYIDKVANGSTNIVFIRRKERKDVPFFTVEVDNNKVIRQVHGFCNCNANTVDGLTEFVEKWAKEKKLVVGAINTVR